MDLVKLYEEIAVSANLISDKEGNLSLKTIDGEINPATIGGKRIVLPTREQLDNGDPEATVIFHPFSENLSRGPSEVLDRLTKAFAIRLEDGIACMISKLLELSASEKEHAQLRGEQLEFMTITKDANEKSCAAFKKIVDADSDGPKFVHIYLNRNPKLKDGKKYGRAGIVTFPIMAELEKETTFGVKLRVKDREMLKAIMLYIFPDCDVEHSYSHGTMSDQAPFLRALLGTVCGLAGQVNTVIERFANVFEDSKQYIIDCDWSTKIQDTGEIAKEAMRIPMQAGNDGRGGEEQAVAVAGTSPVSPAGTSVAAREAPVERPQSLSEAMRQREQTRGYDRDYRDDRRERDYGRSFRDDRREREREPERPRSISELFGGSDRPQRDDRRDSRSGFRDERSSRYFDDNRPRGRGRI